jgi:hypothetical protein
MALLPPFTIWASSYVTSWRCPVVNIADIDEEILIILLVLSFISIYVSMRLSFFYLFLVFSSLFPSSFLTLHFFVCFCNNRPVKRWRT